MVSSKQRPSRLSISSFAFSHERRSSRNLKPVSRPAGVVIASLPEPAEDHALAVSYVSSLDTLPNAEEPLFEDNYIAPLDNDRLPAPPSAALAAKWNEFLQGLSSPAVDVDDFTDGSEPERSASPASDSNADDEDMDHDDPAYCHVEVATPTLLKSPGRPKMVDISPAGSIRSSRPRSSSCDSASSHYSNGSLVSYSAPGTPLSSYYDSDSTGMVMPGAYNKGKLPDSITLKKPEPVTLQTASLLEVDEDSDSDDSSSAEEVVASAEAKAVRQTICRPASSEITRVWYKA